MSRGGNPKRSGRFLDFQADPLPFSMRKEAFGQMDLMAVD